MRVLFIAVSLHWTINAMIGAGGAVCLCNVQALNTYSLHNQRMPLKRVKKNHESVTTFKTDCTEGVCVSARRRM